MAEKMAQVIIPLTVSVGAVALLVGVFLIVYYFQLFQTGRIMLMGDRPWSEYGEEELSTHERILMLEQLDETARNQYLRAQGMKRARGGCGANRFQRGRMRTRPKASTRTSACRSSCRFRRRGCPRGSLNRISS